MNVDTFAKLQGTCDISKSRWVTQTGNSLFILKLRFTGWTGSGIDSSSWYSYDYCSRHAPTVPRRNWIQSWIQGTVWCRGVHRTVTGISRTYTVGLRLREYCSRSRRFFFEAFTVWTAVDTAQNGRITVYRCLISKCAIGSRICCIFHYLKKKYYDTSSNTKLYLGPRRQSHHLSQLLSTRHRQPMEG